MINAKKEAESAVENKDESHSNGTVDEVGGEGTPWKDKRKGKGTNRRISLTLEFSWK